MRLLILFFYVFFFVSCSNFLTKKKTFTPVKPVEINPGPTQPSNKYFEDATERYGLSGIEATHIYAVDLNNNGFTDLVVLPDHYSQPQFYYFNSLEKKFERYFYTPFTQSVKASFLVFADLDNDRIIDVLVGVLNQKSELTQYSVRFFKGSIIKDKIWFTEKKLIDASPAPTSGISLVDVNGDGRLDLYLSNWFQEIRGAPTPVPDRLLVWHKDRWRDQSDLLENELVMNDTKESYINATPSYGASTCDLDGDGFPEILTASSSGYANKLWHNRYQLEGNKRYFVDIGSKTNYAKDAEGFHVPRGGGRSFFSACADYNNDGLMDVYLGELTHSYDADSVDKSSILTGIKQTEISFMRTEYLVETEKINWSRADKRAIWFDYNLDGLMDLLVMDSGYPPHSRLVLFEQDDRHDFLNVAAKLGIDMMNPSGTITLDINNDGQMDLLTSQSKIRNEKIPTQLKLYINKSRLPGSRSIRFFPRGITANTHAIGAMIQFQVKKVNGKIEWRSQWVEYTQGGLPSQNEEGILFGLAQGEVALQVRVRWPTPSGVQAQGRSTLEKNYKLDGIKFDQFLPVTLCEDGRIFLEKKFCD